jgi:hypothetical protein
LKFSENTTRFDEYAAKRLSLGAPSPSTYQVVDKRDITSSRDAAKRKIVSSSSLLKCMCRKPSEVRKDFIITFTTQ